MNSLKQVIVNAIVKVSEDPMYGGREYATSEEARIDFIKALIAELFPECPEYVLPATVQVPAVVVEEKDGGSAPVKEKKKRAPKKKEEAAPVVEVVAAPAEEKKDAPVEAAPEKEKKKRAPKKAAPVEAPTSAPAAAGAGEEAVAAAPEKKKRGPKPKVVENAVNHPKKLNKTEENKVKAIAKEVKVETDETKVLEYLNGLSAEEYAAKSFDEHVRAFLTPTVTVVEEKVAKRGLLVEFKGKDFWIDPDTKKVYATTGSVDEHVGHVGMLEFAEMEIPEYDLNDLDVIEN